MANSLVDIWIRKQDVKLSKLRKCNYAGSVGYLWWGQIIMLNQRAVVAAHHFSALTVAMLSLSGNVDQRGRWGDPALHLSEKSLSSSWNKGKVTFISRRAPFSKRRVKYLSLLAHPEMNWLVFWMEFKKWPMSASVTFMQTEDEGNLPSPSLQLCPGLGVWTSDLVEISAAASEDWTQP